jgi:hypothetical protein
MIQSFYSQTFQPSPAPKETRPVSVQHAPKAAELVSTQTAPKDQKNQKATAPVSPAQLALKAAELVSPAQPAPKDQKNQKATASGPSVQLAPKVAELREYCAQFGPEAAEFREDIQLGPAVVEPVPPIQIDQKVAKPVSSVQIAMMVASVSSGQHAPKDKNTRKKACTYGEKCNRPDCKFSHPSESNAISEEKKMRAEFQRLRLEYLRIVTDMGALFSLAQEKNIHLW